MTESEREEIRKLLAALDMIANGSSTDLSHYERLNKARARVERMLEFQALRSAAPALAELLREQGIIK